MTILATYKNQSDATIAVDALKTAGVESSEIGIAAMDTTSGATDKVTTTTADAPAGATAGHAAADAASGAVTGGLLGTVGGLLVGVAALSIPGFGPLLAAGPIAAALGLTGVAATAATGAGIGIAAGGITSMVGSLMKSGVPEAVANQVHSTLQTGGVVVTVKEHPGVDIQAALQTGSPLTVTSMA